MSLLDTIIDFLKNPARERENAAPEGTCPVCWGYQEYDSKIRKLLKDKQVDVNHGQDSYMKVRKFMVKYVDGIRLKQGIVETCPTCGHQNETNKTEGPQKK